MVTSRGANLLANLLLNPGVTDLTGKKEKTKVDQIHITLSMAFLGGSECRQGPLAPRISMGAV